MIHELYEHIVKDTLDEFKKDLELGSSDETLKELCVSLSELFSQVAMEYDYERMGL